MGSDGRWVGKRRTVGECGAPSGGPEERGASGGPGRAAGGRSGAAHVRGRGFRGGGLEIRL